MTIVNAQLTKTAKIGVLTLCGAALAGCAKNHAPPAVAIEPEPTPLVIDEATQMRDWDRSTAFYANGDVASPPVREKFGKPNTGNEWYDALLEPLYFAGNTLYLPISLFEQPPGTTVYSTGAQIEPTYTAAPVLPPAPPREPKPEATTLPGTAPTIENLTPPEDTGPVGGAADPRSGPPRERSAPAPGPAPDGTPAPQPPPQPNPTPDATANPAPAPDAAPAPNTNPPPAPAPAPDAAPVPAPAPAPGPDANPAPAPTAAPPTDQGAAPAPAPAPDANK